MPIVQSWRDFSGSIASLMRHAMNCIRMLGIGTIPEHVAMLGSSDP
jgi:hypothetical protein